MAYQHPKSWEECPREDLKIIPKMEAAGWKPAFTSSDRMHKRTTLENIPQDGVGFSKNGVHVWQGYNWPADGISFWRCASLIDGNYTAHRNYATLDEVIEKEGK